MLVNDVSLRILIPAELVKGFGFLQSKAASAFSPVVVTPDELGDDWREGRLHRPLLVHVNGKLFGRPDAGTDMVFNFPQLVAHLAKTREVAAGLIIGSGTVSNKQGGLNGSSIDNGGVGYACLAVVRMYETIGDLSSGVIACRAWHTRVLRPDLCIGLFCGAAINSRNNLLLRCKSAYISIDVPIWLFQTSTFSLVLFAICLENLARQENCHIKKGNHELELI